MGWTWFSSGNGTIDETIMPLLVMHEESDLCPICKDWACPASGHGLTDFQREGVRKIAHPVIVTDAKTLTLTEEECKTLYNGIKNDYISYENQALHAVIDKIARVAREKK